MWNWPVIPGNLSQVRISVKNAVRASRSGNYVHFYSVQVDCRHFSARDRKATWLFPIRAQSFGGSI